MAHDLVEQATAVILVLLLLVHAGRWLGARPQRGGCCWPPSSPRRTAAHRRPPAAGRRLKEALVLATCAAAVLAPAGARGAGGRPVPPWVPALAGLLLVGLASAAVVGGTQAVLG